MATLVELAPGTVFGGDFKVVRLLGEGGMGAVYVAVQQSTATPRALKLMQRELVQDPQMRERFELEARLGSRIESDHVVQVVAAGIDTDTGIPWIAMELLRGLSLDDYLAQQGRLPPGEVRFLFEQLCHALGAAHGKGVVHRDLKPPNVFLSVPRVVGLSYMVKVLDFGIAKVLAEAKTTRTAAIGTPLYMAPEQYQAGKVTPATDVWALGLIAFELLTGRSYWKAAAGADATPAKLMYETCMGELGPASGRVVELGLEAPLPDGFDAWFARTVCREPSERFATASEAFEALGAVLGPAEPPRAGLRVPDDDLAIVSAAAEALSGATVRASGLHGSGTRLPAGGTVVERSVASARASESGGDGGQTELARPGPTQRSFSSTGPRAGGGRGRLWQLFAIVAAGAVAAAVAVGIASRGGAPLSATAEDATGELSGVQAGLVASDSATAPPAEPGSHFVADGAVVVDARLAHGALPPGQRVETQVMLELRGKDTAPAARMPVHLALVIDRSGSMAGERIRNAISAAVSAVGRLQDGDMVSVTAFDTQVLKVVAPTVLGAASRAGVVEAIQRLTLGGDTCMSCGISAALADLGTSSSHVGRVLLLSDGAANVGVRDENGFAALGRQAQQAEVSITTIGVGIDYNERILAAISREATGRHYFAESEASLGRIFDAEAQAMGGVVATQAEARIELAPGVELAKVFDRAHRVEGSSVVVPLGPFPRGEVKTVLVAVALTPPASGSAPICRVAVVYRDQVAGAPGETSGRLAARVSPSASLDDTDPAVDVRVQRSLTASSLVKANELFAAGKVGEADKELAAQQSRLEGQKANWARRGVAPDAAHGATLDELSKSVATARGRYQTAARAQPPAAAAASPMAKRAAREGMMDAYDAAY